MKRFFLITAAVAAVSFIGTSSVWAAPCITDTVADYEALGATGCTVGTVTFSSVSVSSIVSGSGTIILGDIVPVMLTIAGVTEDGLALNYAANTGTTPGSQADVGLIYNVSSTVPLTDAFADYTGTMTGTGTTSLSETLSNGSTIELTAPGAQTITFAPTTTLGVIKDQNDFAGSAGSSETSLLENAFSTTTTPVPEPASVALLGTALFGIGWVARRPRRS